MYLYIFSPGLDGPPRAPPALAVKCWIATWRVSTTETIHLSYPDQGNSQKRPD